MTLSKPQIPEPAHRIRLHPPDVNGSTVAFRFTVSPQTELYRRTDFRLSFPAELEIERVPSSLWWRVMLVCMHTHFALLAPCLIELPVRLNRAEREYWLRLVNNVIVQLEAYGSAPRPGRIVEFRDAGQALEPVRLGGDPDRAAAAFSGGKDSLVLAALLAELTERPLLVTVTSPVPWARDHLGAARQRARSEIARRLPVDAVEVQSDFRTSWELGFSTLDGCALGVHELSDLALYHGVVAAVAAAQSIGCAFMASEADLQYNLARNGSTVLHREFLSCSVTQGALDALLRDFGIRQGSLTYPLHSAQVQALLLRRYRQLADLQFSCWKAPPGKQSCSSCDKCFLITLFSLAEGVSPRAVGIDPVRVLSAYSDWHVDAPPSQPGPRLGQSRSARHHVVRALQRLPTATVASILAGDGVPDDDGSLRQALAIYARLRAEALRKDIPPEPGYVTDFLELVPAGLRGPLEAILAEHFPPTSEPEFRAMSKRARALTAWIGEPLEAERGRGGGDGASPAAPGRGRPRGWSACR